MQQLDLACNSLADLMAMTVYMDFDYVELMLLITEKLGFTIDDIYGVSLKLKRPMYAVMIGCFAGALYAGFVGLKAFAFMTPSVLNFAMWMDTGNNLMNAGITALITIVVTFIATWLLGFEDPVEEKSENKLNVVNAPVEGTIIDLSEVKDQAFSSESLGKGIEYIENNLTNDITIEEISSYSYISSFYFQKGFF